MTDTRRLTPDQFKAVAPDLSSEDSQILIYGKMAAAPIEQKDGELVFTISTDAVDRDNDTIDPAGWELDSFKSNPVVLWAHDQSLPPIGRASGVWVEGNRVRSSVQFTPPDMKHPLGDGFGDTVRRMFQDGFMHATSVGFLPREFKFNQERGSMAVDFVKQELLEFSAVPVPANQQALVDGKRYQLSGLKSWCELVIETGKDEWAIEQAKCMHKALGNKGAWVDLGAVKKDDETEHSEPEPEAIETIEPVEVLPGPKAYHEACKEAEAAEAHEVDRVLEFAAELCKRGRVLSAANESKLRDAVALLADVLGKLETQEDDDELVQVDDDVARDLGQLIADEVLQLAKRHKAGGDFLEVNSNG